MTDRELMQQALDALEGAIDAHQNEINDHITKYGEWYRPQRLEFMKKELANTEQTIEALRARLAQPKPVMAEFKFQDYGWWRDENGKLQCGTIPQDRSGLPLLRPGEFCKFVEGKEDFRGLPVVMSVWPTQEGK